MTVLLTLTLAGSDTGPFDLYSNANNYVSPFQTGVTKTSLLSGYSVIVPDTATIIRVKSNGICVSSVDIVLQPFITTTTTTTIPSVLPLLYDGAGIANSNSDYTAYRNATTGTFIDYGRSSPLFGVLKIDVTPFQGERSFFSINTSSVIAPIASASLWLDISLNPAAGSVVVMKYTGVEPINALTVNNFDSLDFAQPYSSVTPVITPSGFMAIPLNAQALLDINSNNSLDIVLISGGEFNNIAPPSSPSNNLDGGYYIHGTQYISYVYL